ncbi:SDR family NAD(P)-dependent oxidoreductase [Cognatishimia sp. F0-27]|uniref:SDR family NAD(P)-dependent oxidoreductase n=1 Tax=Cognatishimia sp. F0-27 TaxID=2816855 RepID=UPI001D0C7E33|nr:SDR family NAD(P)-dependent oxidoreductase [Cognatishimia sp. F0-27]MCC1491136.1 SDR family NAD(P)-dependent oxidoreductase [Cognatishimia sp. F0-27]
MTRALLIGDSGGIGSALHAALDAKGFDITGLSRARDGFDVTDETAVQDGLAALDGPFDLMVVATGALEIDGAEPEKTLKALEPRAFLDQMALNALGPALVLKHGLRLLPRRDRAVFAALSARVGSIGDNRLGGWYSYRAAKSALNQVMHGAAVELGRSHKALCVACLHPGTVATPFTRKYLDRHPSVPPQEAAANLVSVLERLGPEHSGGFYDYAFREIPW